MAMNKKEQAEFDEMRGRLAAAMALRWPGYDAPKPVDHSTIKYSYGKPTQGWFQWNTSDDYKVTLGCSSGIHHSTTNPLETTSQGGGRYYTSKVDALKAARVQMSERFARVLAKIDAEIKTNEVSP